MNFARWLASCFSHRRQALAIYRRGMTKAKAHDYRGAIDDYTATIEMPGTPSDVKSMALYNRALMYVAAGDEQKGLDDLATILAMDEARENIKAMARQKRIRMESRSHRFYQAGHRQPT